MIVDNLSTEKVDQIGYLQCKAVARLLQASEKVKEELDEKEYSQVKFDNLYDQLFTPDGEVK